MNIAPIDTGEHLQRLLALVDGLRERGVFRYTDGITLIEFGSTNQSTTATAASATAQASPPEQSTGTIQPEEKRDIFDVLASGVIPGAPSATGYPTE